MTQRINFDHLRTYEAAKIVFIRAAIAASTCDDLSDIPCSDGEYELEFKIGGKEVDFVKFCRSFDKMYEADLLQVAEERLRKLPAFERLLNSLNELEAAIVPRVSEMIRAIEIKEEQR